MAKDIIESMNKNISTLLDNQILGPVLVLLFFMPQEYAIGVVAFKIWQYVQMGVFVLTLFAIVLKNEITKRWLFFCGFYLCFYLVSSVVNSTFAVLSSNIYECAKGIAFISVCELYYQRSPKLLLRNVAIGGGLICLFHILSVAGVLLHLIPRFTPAAIGNYPATGINYYFLTYDNESVLYLLPAIVALVLFGWAYSRLYLILGICLLSVSVIEFVALDTVTALVSMGISVVGMGIALVVGKLVNSNTRIPYKRLYTLTVTTMLVLCVVIVIGVSSGAFAKVAILLGKDGNFSGRAEIWNSAIESVKLHPIFGRGREGFEITRLVIGQTHVHNIILEILYTGGILSLALYVGGILSCVSELNTVKPEITAFVYALSVVVAFFVAAYMDWYPSIPVTLFLFYAPVLVPNTIKPIDISNK